MRCKKGSIFMTNFLYAPQTKNHPFNNLSVSHKASTTVTKTRIAHYISESCTKPLLIALLKMNQSLTSSIVDYVTLTKTDRGD